MMEGEVWRDKVLEDEPINALGDAMKAREAVLGNTLKEDGRAVEEALEEVPIPLEEVPVRPPER